MTSTNTQRLEDIASHLQSVHCLILKELGNTTTHEMSEHIHKSLNAVFQARLSLYHAISQENGVKSV